MTKFLSTLSIASTLALMTMTTGAFAGDGCGEGKACGAEKVACSGGADMAKGGAADAAKSCESACGDKVACAETVAMAKGGAADSTTPMGYGLDQKVPNFTLTDTNGKSHNLTDFAGKPVALVFYNQACPFVIEMWDRMDTFTKTYGEKGVQVLAIDAGVNNNEADIKTHAEKRAFPILVNRESDLAVKFGATHTPEVFLLNQQGVVVYHGAFDNGQRGSAEGARQSYLADAANAVLAGNTPDVRQTKAFGCSIKFAPGSK